MDYLSVKVVDVLGVQLSDSLERRPQRVCRLRSHDEMNMVAHETVAVDLEAELPRGFPQHAEIGPPIIVDEEDVLAVVPSLCYVMRTIGNDDSWRTRHRRQCNRKNRRKIGSVPIL